MKDKLKDKKVKCRICNGEHFTARCPFKDTMAPVGEEGAADVAAGPGDDAPPGPGGLGAGKSSYVPPHMRNGAGQGGEKMGGGKYERDDLATLRVTNVSYLGDCILDCFTVLTMVQYRFLRWQKNKNFGICLSDSVGLQESFWQKIGRRVLPRVLHLSVSRREQMLLRRVRRWMAMVSSI